MEGPILATRFGSRPDGESGSRMIGARRYLAIMCGLFAIALIALLVWGLSGRDHFGAIDRSGDTSWFQNYYSLTRREIQDKDIFFHNIGSSVAHAREADIVLLGHSVVLGGIRDELLQEFRKDTGVKIFNMALGGVPSGQFIKRAIRKWNIKPKLWIINADDQGARFFSPDIHDYGRFATTAGDIAKTTRLKGWQTVAARNMRWRLQAMLARALPEAYAKTIFERFPAPPTYRSVLRGSVNYDEVPAYSATDHRIMKVTRDQNCHSDAEEAAVAKSYLKAIGQRVVLVLMPHEVYCPTRVRELAANLGLETIITPNVDYSTSEGVHLDFNGAFAYTRFFLDALPKTKAFKETFGEIPTAVHGDAIDICYENTSKAGHFLSLRSDGATRDLVVGAGQTLRERGDARGMLCQFDKPFGREICPNPMQQSWLACPSAAQARK